MEIDPESYDGESPKLRVARRTFIVVSCAMMVALSWLLFSMYRLQTQIGSLQADVAKSQAIVISEMTKVRELSTFMSSTNRRTMKSIREELEEAKHEVVASAGQARLDAQVTVQRLARELKAQQQREHDNTEMVKQQLADTHQATASAEAHITDVKNEVGSVKSEVGSVKHEVAQAQTNLTKAVVDLRRMLGDMGVMSGLIATNQKELDVLKTLGERKYTEFRLPKTKELQVVNGVALLLKRTDPVTGRFTLEVIADDVKVQKKDKTRNEPVQFYVANSKQPYEIVINNVGKNEVAGYLASPVAAAPVQ